jgi:hypothetical protein
MDAWQFPEGIELKVATRGSEQRVFDFHREMVREHSAFLTERDDVVLTRTLEDYSFRYVEQFGKIVACSGSFVTIVPGIFELGGTGVVTGLRKHKLCCLLTAANVWSGHGQRHRLITRIALSNDGAYDVAVSKLQFQPCKDLPEELREDDQRQYPEGSHILEPSEATTGIAADVLLSADESPLVSLKHEPLRNNEHVWAEIKRAAKEWRKRRLTEY